MALVHKAKGDPAPPRSKLDLGLALAFKVLFWAPGVANQDKNQTNVISQGQPVGGVLCGC